MIQSDDKATSCTEHIHVHVGEYIQHLLSITFWIRGIYMHTYIHTYIRMYIYTYVCMRIRHKIYREDSADT